MLFPHSQFSFPSTQNIDTLVWGVSYTIMHLVWPTKDNASPKANCYNIGLGWDIAIMLYTDLITHKHAHVYEIAVPFSQSPQYSWWCLVLAEIYCLLQEMWFIDCSRTYIDTSFCLQRNSTLSLALQKCKASICQVACGIWTKMGGAHMAQLIPSNSLYQRKRLTLPQWWPPDSQRQRWAARLPGTWPSYWLEPENRQTPGLWLKTWLLRLW